MKNILLFLPAFTFLTSISNLSCQKSNDSSGSGQAKDAVITGNDQRLCPCCGGLMINFNNETRPYTGTFYLIDNDLSGYGITSSSTFPIFVKVEYTVLDKCSHNYINVNNLTKR